MMRCEEERREEEITATPPPVQSDQSPDEDPHEKDAIRCGERPFERNAVLPDDDNSSISESLNILAADDYEEYGDDPV